MQGGAGRKGELGRAVIARVGCEGVRCSARVLHCDCLGYELEPLAIAVPPHRFSEWGRTRQLLQVDNLNRSRVSGRIGGRRALLFAFVLFASRTLDVCVYAAVPMPTRQRRAGVACVPLAVSISNVSVCADPLPRHLRRMKAGLILFTVYRWACRVVPFE
jgi:hypothetical protein